MIITFKKIAGIVNCEDAPIEYYNYENCNKQKVLYFNCIKKEYWSEYEKMSENEQKEYISDSATIFLPLISPDYYKKITQNMMSPDYSWTLKRVENKIDILPEYESMAVALYMILHEIGHWCDFLRCGKKPYLYMEKEKIEEEKKLLYDGRELQQRLSLKENLTLPDLNQLDQFVFDYNNLPKEKSANIYADEHIVERYEKLCKELNIK